MRSRWTMTLAALVLGIAAMVYGQSAPLDALDGLDPVLLVQGREVAGKTDLKVVRGRFEYSFSSSETKAEFEKAPARYEIQLNGVCARMGPTAGGNPADYAVHDGRIYIFGSDECHKRFVATPAKFLPPTPAAMPAARKAHDDGRALVDRAVAAIGGAARLDALTSYVEAWSFIQPGMQGDVPVDARALWRFPGGVRMERTMKRGDRLQTSARVLSADAAWFDGGPGRVFPMRPDAVAELEQTFGHYLVPLLRSRTSPDFETAALGPAAMAGVTVERVRVRRGPVDVTLGVDGTSGEVRAISFVGRNGEGEFGNYEIALSDYRAVGGLRVPHSERAAFDGVADPALTRTLQTITLDAPLDAALFSRGGGD